MANSNSETECNSSSTHKIIKSGSNRGDGLSSGTFTPLSEEERRKASSESKIQRALPTPLISESSAAVLHPVGHKFHEVFQFKQGQGQGRYSDLSTTKISEMMKSNTLDNAPTQSLLSVVNGILDESIERKNGEIPQRVACLLRKVVQEIERRLSTQAEHLRTQNNLFKSREEKYQSRIRVLEALASGAAEETKQFTNQPQPIKQTESPKTQEQEKVDDERRKFMEENDRKGLEIIALKQELEILKAKEKKRKLKDNDKSDLEIAALKQEIAILKDEEQKRKLKDNDKSDLEIAALKQELAILKDEEQKRKLKDNDKSDLEIAALKRELEILKDEEEKRRLKENDRNNLEIASLKQELEVVKDEEEKRWLKENDKNKLEIAALKQELENAKKMHEQYCLEVEAEIQGAKAGLQMRLRELESHLADSNNKVKEIEASSQSKCQKWNMKESIYHNFINVQFGAMQELRISSQSIKQEIIKTKRSYSEEFSNFGVKLKPLTNAAENYHELLNENRKLFNELQDLKGNIRVFCRIRPFLPGQAGRQTIVDSISENGQLVVGNPSKPGKDGQRSFKFNKVYGPAATQAEVFSDIQPFVQSVVDGYNVCIFAYGQTGSGKTYTMTGPNGATEEEWGVNYRSMNYLFKLSQNRRSSINYEIGVQMIEIYNELVRDLLSNDSSQKKLAVTTISQPNGLAVPDASMHPVLSASDVLNLINTGFNNRAVTATALNERSSRSHSIVTIHVRGKDMKSGTTLFGNLHLVDLAGSERVDRSGVTGEGLKEAQHINKSLSSLGDVIFALAQKSLHVPYRNSKLTQVLQSSLGGQAKTLMFVQLNPDVTSYTESMSTLKFAERVSGVELGAARSSKEGKDVKELMDQMASLKDTIAKKDEEIERLQLLKDLKNGFSGIDSEQHGIGSLSDKHSEVGSQLYTDDATEVGTETDASSVDIALSPESPSMGLGRNRVVSMTRLQQKPEQGKTTPKLPDSPRVSTTAKLSDSPRVSTSLKKSLSSASLKTPVRK